MKTLFAVLFLVLVFGLAASRLSEAQEPLDPLRPSIPRPGRSASWAIDYTYKGAEPGKDKTAATSAVEGMPRIKREAFVIDGEKSVKDTVLTSEKTERRYQQGKYEIFQEPASQVILVQDISFEPQPSQTYRKSFPGFEGLRPRDHVGKAVITGQKCDYFRNGETEAWVNEETNLPVAIRNGERTGRYAFQEPPAEGVQLPQNLRKYLRDHFKNGPPPGQAASLVK